MFPARLHKGEIFFVDERAQRALQHVGRRHEIGIEHGHIFGGACFQTGFQRACLETLAVFAVEQNGINPARAQFVDLGLGNARGFVGGIVEQLDVQAVARPVDGGGGFK